MSVSCYGIGDRNCEFLLSRWLTHFATIINENSSSRVSILVAYTTVGYYLDRRVYNSV